MKFTYLPIEIRHLIWQATLPGCRIITEHGRQNELLPLLMTCRESRIFVTERYQRVLSPAPDFPSKPTSVLYIESKIDIVVWDLTAWKTFEDGLFRLSNHAITCRLLHIFTGLSHIRRVALAYNVLLENGERSWYALQACCPALKYLYVIPSSQLEPVNSQNADIKLVDLDSNFMDLTLFTSEPRVEENRVRRYKIPSRILQS